MAISRPQKQTPVPAARRFVSFFDLKERFGIPWCRMQVDREEKAGRFPKRVKVGAHSVAWLEDEVIAWQAERIAQREPPKAA